MPHGNKLNGNVQVQSAHINIIHICQQQGRYIARQRQSKHVNSILRTALPFQRKAALDGLQPTTLCSLGEHSTKGQLSWYVGSNLQDNTWMLLETKFSFKNSMQEWKHKCLSIGVHSKYVRHEGGRVGGVSEGGRERGEVVEWDLRHTKKCSTEHWLSSLEPEER